MSLNTKILELFKYQTPEDDLQDFDIDQALNNNWDKIDQHASETDQKIQDIYTVKAEQNEVTNLDNRVKTLEADVTKESYIPHTQTESIKSLPTGSLEGSVKDLKFDGLTLINEVKNGDFSDGADGWDVSNGTHDVVNKIYTMTSNTSSAFLFTTKATKSIAKGEKRLIKVRILTDKLNSQTLACSVLGSDTGTISATLVSGVREIMNPEQNKYYDLEFIVDTSNITGTISIRITGYDGYGGDYNGSSIKIDGNTGVFDINMSTLEIEDYTEEQMLQLAQKYFDGMKSVENPKIEVVGRNLFNPLNYELVDSSFIEKFKDDYTHIKNSETVSFEHVNFPIKIKKNEDHTIKIEAYSVSGSDNPYIVIRDDDNKATVISSQTFPFEYTLNLNSNNITVFLYANVSSASIQEKKYKVKLEEGSAATGYNPYKYHPIKINETFRRVPGAKDSCYFLHNEIWKDKKVEKFALNNGIFVLQPGSETTNYYGVVLNNSITKSVEGILIQNYKQDVVSNYSLWETTDTELIYRHVDGKLYFKVPKTAYTSGFTDAETKQWALNNNIILQYELQQSEQINLTDLGLVEGELLSEENGTCYLDGDSLFPQNVSFEVPANTGATIGSLVESSDYQAKQISTKANKVQEDWIEPTLLNGWVNNSGTTRYAKNDLSYVTLEFSSRGGTTTQATTIFELPIGYRPTKTVVFPIFHLTSGIYQGNALVIRPTGAVQITAYPSQIASERTYTGSISFRTEG